MTRRPIFWLSGLAALALAFAVGAFAATTILVTARAPRGDGALATAARLGAGLLQASAPAQADDAAPDADVAAEAGDAEGEAGTTEHPCGEKGFRMRLHRGLGAMAASLGDGRVAGVTEDGPAAAAGLAEGDRITAIDGEEIAPGGLAEAIGARKPGDVVDLTVERDGETLERSATLAEHPDDPAKGYLGILLGGPTIVERRIVGPDGEAIEVVPGAGMHRMPLPEALRERLDALEEGGPFALSGAVVLGAEAEGPAAAAGLAEGDLIEAIDGVALDTPGALPEALAERAPGDVVTLTVTGADGAARDVEVTLGARPDDETKAWLGARIGPFLKIDRTGDGEGDVLFEFGGAVPHRFNGHEMPHPEMRWFHEGAEGEGPDRVMPAVPAIRLGEAGGTL